MSAPESVPLVPAAMLHALTVAHAENARLRLAIRRLAEQDATLSVCDGNVTVTMDAALTDAEREALNKMRVHLYEISRDNAFIDEVCDDAKAACAAVMAFLERTK